MITEANEHNPSSARAYAAWQEQIHKGETLGVQQMYEDAYREALARESKESHYQYSQRIKPTIPCTAAHIVPGGYCLNCGWRD